MKERLFRLLEEDGDDQLFPVCPTCKEYLIHGEENCCQVDEDGEEL